MKDELKLAEAALEFSASQFFSAVLPHLKEDVLYYIRAAERIGADVLEQIEEEDTVASTIALFSVLSFILSFILNTISNSLDSNSLEDKANDHEHVLKNFFSCLKS